MKNILFFVLTGFIFWSVSAQANMTQIKAYKEAFADAKPKCIDCHVDKMPKKDGAHDPNDYGKAVLTAAKAAGVESPTADTYKKVGTIEDFAKNAPAAAK